jgi:hypothetical protein
MDTNWIKDLKGIDRENFIKRLSSCNDVLDKLKEICYNKQIELNRVRLKDYDTPNWALHRAHQDGFMDGLDYLISLLTLDKREKV